MRTSPKALTLAIFSVFCSTMLLPIAAFAESSEIAVGSSTIIAQSEGDVASGNWGTCPWEISADGTLTVHPGRGETQQYAEHSPWQNHSTEIKAIVFKADGDEMVIAPENSNNLFAGLRLTERINLIGLDSSNISSAEGMFGDCSSLACLVLGNRTTKLGMIPDGDWVTDPWSNPGNHSYSAKEIVESRLGILCSYYKNPQVSLSKASGDPFTYASPDSFIYDGTPKCPTTTHVRMGLHYGNLVESRDYNVSWPEEECVNVGTYYVAFIGKGYYYGEASAAFIIEPALIDSAAVSVASGALTYDGIGKTPSVTVTYGSKVLRAEDDYELSWSNNVDAGTAYVEATGKGNYRGTALGSFSISPAPIAQASIAIPDQTYTGSVLEPKATVTLSGKELVNDVDYTISYKDNVEVGTAIATVTGKGNYTGEAPSSFEIKKATNTLSANAASLTMACRYSDNEDQVLASSNISVSDAIGSVSFENASEGTAAEFRVDAYSGVVMVPRRTAPGQYRMKVIVKAQGDNKYEAGSQMVEYSIVVEQSDLATYTGAAVSSGMYDLKPGEWFMDPATGAFPGTSTLYIDYTIKRGLMSGYKDKSGKVTAFGPHDKLERAQTATILYRLANPDSLATTDPAHYEANKTPLSDVESNEYYTAAVNWCVEKGIITGYKDKVGQYYAFGPHDPVAREQLATMIFRYCTRYAKQPMTSADIKSFSDYNKISYWAREGVAYCVANRIVGGYTDGSNRFDPADSAERCQMAKIIAVTARMLE